MAAAVATVSRSRRRPSTRRHRVDGHSEAREAASDSRMGVAGGEKKGWGYDDRDAVAATAGTAAAAAGTAAVAAAAGTAAAAAAAAGMARAAAVVNDWDHCYTR